MKPFWITFYSYKGGVGRSLALANTAALLVKRGRRVVLIDFDLEAPGMDSFQEFKSVAGKPGVVEYVTEFQHTKRAPDISQFVHACEFEPQPRGQLWLMPAGKRDAAYNACRAKLDWVRFYDSGLGEPFIENWKAAIARHCQPDYVLVDSRTGLTDVGGICTLHLPDLVVLIFGLNGQNIQGIAAVAKTIRESEFLQLPQIHYVASPVPNLPPDENGPLAERLAAAAKRLGTKIESSIRYAPIAALRERLFVFDPDLETSPLVSDYQRLIQRLMDYNRSGLDFLWTQAQEAISQVDPDLMARLLAVFQEEYPTQPESLLARAYLSHALGQADAATKLAAAALNADPTFEATFQWLLNYYCHKHDFKAALAVWNSVLKHADRFPPPQRYHLYLRHGQMAMAASEPAVAAESFKMTRSFLKALDFETESFLISMFNETEAIRRATGHSQNEACNLVIEMFKMTGETSAAPLVLQASRWQAMHIPFALTGDVPRAREALAKARHAAQRLGPAEDVFTIKTYTEVPAKEFLQINDEMISALDRGQLWDGMALPKAKPTKQSGPEGDPAGLTEAGYGKT